MSDNYYEGETIYLCTAINGNEVVNELCFNESSIETFKNEYDGSDIIIVNAINYLDDVVGAVDFNVKLKSFKNNITND